MFPKIEDPEAWNAQVLEICETYRDAIELYRTQGIHTVSIDEQTGIQAIERIAADLLPQSGMIARREYEYIRHGLLGYLETYTSRPVRFFRQYFVRLEPKKTFWKTLMVWSVPMRRLNGVS